jgi:DNA replication protein DnaC
LGEPKTLAESIAETGILDRLAKVDTSDVEVGPSHDETPEQARARIAKSNAAKARRWQDELPEEYAEATLDDLDPAVRSRIEEWLGSPRARNLVLVGNIGAGKTHTAYAVCNHLLREAGLWVEAWTVYDLMAAMRPDGDPYAYEHACKANLLLLDDLGASKPSEWAVATLEHILNARVNGHRRTIITTNHGEPALRGAWGDRFADRLRTGLAVVRFEGQSRREAAF